MGNIPLQGTAPNVQGDSMIILQGHGWIEYCFDIDDDQQTEGTDKMPKFDVAASQKRALTGQPNLDGLKPLTRSKAALRRAIEEADWLGDKHRTEALEVELSFVEAAIARGETYSVEW